MPDNIITDTADTSKPWYQSRGVIGSVVAIVSGAAGAFGYGIPVEIQGQAVDLIATIGAVVGGAVALYGRLKAVHRIG